MAVYITKFYRHGILACVMCGEFAVTEQTVTGEALCHKCLHKDFMAKVMKVRK